jgi:tetratricopeptide (TPR) repeat protein
MCAQLASHWVLPCHLTAPTAPAGKPASCWGSSSTAYRTRRCYRFIERCCHAVGSARPATAEPEAPIGSGRDVSEEQVQLQRAAKGAKLSGNLSRSREILAAALEKYPGDKNFRAQLASAEAKLGCTQRALDLLHEGLQDDPSNVYFLTSAASIYGQQRKYERARELFQRGYSVARDSAPLLQVRDRPQLPLGQQGGSVSLPLTWQPAGGNQLGPGAACATSRPPAFPPPPHTHTR